jgi:ParB-like chromosome segregation protein Spo0J
MTLKQLPLEVIDFSDESFRISETIDSDVMLQSIRAVGQLNPVWLLDDGPKKRIVCGFRRLSALRRLGVSAVLARVLSKETCDTAKAFQIALYDNLAHRQLDVLEKARALLKLQDLCAVPRETLVKIYLPLLGLAAHESVLSTYLSLNTVHPDLRRCLTEGRLTQGSVESLAAHPLQAQADFAALMGRVRWSASLQKKILVLLEELTAIEGTPLTEPLGHPEIQAVLNDPALPPFQRGERVFEILYRLRNPRLSEATRRFLENKKLLRLPGSIQISADPFFETPGLKVEFHAHDAARFRDLADVLQKASRHPILEELFDVR